MRPTAATGLLGTVVGDKYEIERVLGTGGVGVVVAALHVHLGQRVALKFLLDDVRHDAQVVERFLREARAAGGLRSEHVGRVIDVATLDTGAPYLVMELLAGNDLAAELQRTGPLPVGVVADYMLQALVGLAEAHAQGIVHRDLKPANLFLTHRPDGTPCIKVLDFGIGSPAYMAPEQLRSSRSADVRSDIWALGAIMYELVSGRAPFAGATVADLALRIAM
jgi:serine/threonine-protein kinase